MVLHLLSIFHRIINIGKFAVFVCDVKLVECNFGLLVIFVCEINCNLDYKWFIGQNSFARRGVRCVSQFLLKIIGSVGRNQDVEIVIKVALDSSGWIFFSGVISNDNEEELKRVRGLDRVRKSLNFWEFLNCDQS